MKLPAFVPIRSIDADQVDVGAETWVRVDSPLARVDFRQVEVAELDPAVGLDVVQMRCLEPLLSVKLVYYEKNPALRYHIQIYMDYHNTVLTN